MLRHLVLEWAEAVAQDSDVLKKTGVGYGDGQAMPGMKRKLDMGRRIRKGWRVEQGVLTSAVSQ